ncbi:MAG TPA: membrane protein insertase YidC [Spirochaetaceae bacterium]|jgi:YidC/Oxa1 family membrane protein insertase|nr:membrane protein insertase YidC [Spirochaetaceae bacterium]HOI23539.1 membrane protein insertase YidC [Spirochaetales bacterium]
MSIFNDGSQSKEESRRTILAVVLSTVIVGVGFMLQNVFFPPAPQSAQSTAQTTQQLGETAGPPPPAATVVADPFAPTTTVSTAQAAATAPAAVQTPPVEAPVAKTTYTVETDLLKVVLSNSGGDIVSLQLKEHKDKEGYVDLIVPGEKGSQGISLAFGAPGSPTVGELMNVSWLDTDRKTIQFSRVFYARSSEGGELKPFTYRKTYTFRNGEYLFGMAIGLEGENGAQIPLNSNGTAYTLSVGPQIGPRFDHLSKNADYRKYILEVEGKKKTEMPKAGNLQVIKERPSWGSMTGKYFSFIAIPELPFASFSYLQGQDSLIKQTNTMYLSRPAISSSAQTDKYYFYFGPRTNAHLAKYEYADKNSFGLSSMKLEDVVERSNLLGWLETILKFMLNISYKLIPNYGVAIILVTIFIKVLFYPLTKKSSVSTARMQELQPKLQELQAKYKGNPQKLNQEMAEFYKRENYNPMSGCLPMLIQFPLFIAMYNLFNNHFDLRGASFIAGWINDLSLPESIVNFGSFRLPILGWNDLRALPIIYLASQLLYGKFTQSPQGGQNAGQMKLMMYGMPIMFFFILYDVPSGLLLYWIVSNLLTIAQQVVIKDLLKKHKLTPAKAPAPASGPMRNAGRTSVRASGESATQDDLGEKVKNWLEKKAAGMDGKSSASTRKPGSSKGDKGEASSGKKAGGKR